MSDSERISRRNLVLISAAPFLTPRPAQSKVAGRNPFLSVSGTPDSITAWTEAGALVMTRNGARWQKDKVEVGLTPQTNGFSVSLSSPAVPVLRIHLRWQAEMPLTLHYLGDAWERSYGDLAWSQMQPERVLPWYFLAFDSASTFACGVKTGASALCFWQVDPSGVSLWLDVRNGGRGVKLGSRELHVASVRVESYPDMKPFAAAKRFCRSLCDAPRMPAAPVYGGNNWYYAYGKSSAQDILSDSERIASFSSSEHNRPFMVIDDGWQPNPTAGPWSQGNSRFPDMAQLATGMIRTGVRPGIWLRPTFTKAEIPEAWRLKSPNAEREYSARKGYTLDPTIPEALQQMTQDIETMVKWGYQLIKHDFSTYDLLGRWGRDMGAVVTNSDWSFADVSRTTAEIIRSYYQALREAAGDVMLLGCNTIGYLGAGLFELQRIGDDTSGRDWNRTRKMGVNTLAFRAPQHGTFFAIDADCVGLTKQIPWALNRQWLDLLARSGTPLFVSAAPDAVGPEQRSALREAFANASRNTPLLEPLDWLQNTEPQQWIVNGRTANYHWFGTDGVSPFAT